MHFSPWPFITRTAKTDLIKDKHEKNSTKKKIKP